MVFRLCDYWLFSCMVAAFALLPYSFSYADLEEDRAIPFNSNKIISNLKENRKADLTSFDKIEPSVGQEAPRLEESESITAKNGKIKEGDSLFITVEHESELTRDYHINQDGAINFPMIGFVHVLGKNIADVKETITRQLKEGYINDPIVFVDLNAAEPIYILGEVAKPGAYEYKENLTPLKAATLAGGFLDGANQDYFELIESSVEKQKAYSSATVKMVPYFKVLKPGDTIRVKNRSFKWHERMS